MKKVILVTTLFVALPTYAATCSNYEQDKAAHFAEIQGREVVKEYQGGRNISTDITSCDYNSYTGKYTVGIDVSWYGSVTSKYYNSSGKMSMDSNGRRRQYNETYRNENLKDYAFWRGMGMIVLVAGAATAASSEQQNGGSIWVRNQCGRSVDVMIYYNDARDKNWKTESWWTFANQETGFLNVNNVRLKTNNAVLYYAIKPSFTSLGLSYHATHTVNGSSYQFRKVIDKTGDTEIRLCMD